MGKLGDWIRHGKNGSNNLPNFSDMRILARLHCSKSVKSPSSDNSNKIVSKDVLSKKMVEKVFVYVWLCFFFQVILSFYEIMRS